MPYIVEISVTARKQLSKLPNSVAERIEESLLDLEDNPRPIGNIKLKGRDAYRMRIGDYRAIYTINDNILKVIVIKVAHRKEVYD
jgi:mRNA interferase RelE/StbE